MQPRKTPVTLDRLAMQKPCVSIGIPTHNRPTGLRRVLECVTRQTYPYLEILVSDNCSDDSAVATVASDFAAVDPRISIFRQESNIGALANFEFVFERATSDYFMWAADDNTFDEGYIERLLQYMHPLVLLVFPNVTLVDANGVIRDDHLGNVYGHCATDIDYLRAWCDNGTGYPLYGLYNLKACKTAGLQFKFDDDLYYYWEGMFLHKLFLRGGALFAKDASLVLKISDKNIDQTELIRSFFDYTKRMTLLYYTTDKLAHKQKQELLPVLLDRHFSQLRRLCALDEHVRNVTCSGRLRRSLQKRWLGRALKLR